MDELTGGDVVYNRLEGVLDVCDDPGTPEAQKVISEYLGACLDTIAGNTDTGSLKEKYVHATCPPIGESTFPYGFEANLLIFLSGGEQENIVITFSEGVGKSGVAGSILMQAVQGEEGYQVISSSIVTRDFNLKQLMVATGWLVTRSPGENKGQA